METDGEQSPGTRRERKAHDLDLVCWATGMGLKKCWQISAGTSDCSYTARVQYWESFAA